MERNVVESQASRNAQTPPQPDLPTPEGMGPNAVPDLRFAMNYEVPVVEATRVMLDYLDALCQRDLKGMAEMCHFPFGTYEGTTPVEVKSVDELLETPPPSMNTTLQPERSTPHDGNITPGSYDAFNGLEILNSDAYSANLAMTYNRFADDGKLLMQCQGVYTVTNNDGKWGIQLMSTIFKPYDLIGIEFSDTIQAALRTRISHDVGPNTNDADADVGNRQPGINFAVSNPSSFVAAQMEASKTKYGGMSPFRTKGVKSRLRVTTVKEEAGSPSGDATLNAMESGGNPNNPADLEKYKNDWHWYRDMYERTGLGKWGAVIGYLPYSRVVQHTVDKAHLFSGLTRYLISGEEHDQSAELSIVTWKKGRWGKNGNGAYITMHDRANDVAHIRS
jgi:hypothetical protein